MQNPQQQGIVQLFLDNLAASTGAQVVYLSLESEWSRTGPEGVRGTTLSEYLHKVGFH